MFENITKNDVELVCTCFACPEQYDVLYRGERIGYIRYRWGILSCHPCDDYGNILWDNELYNWYSDDGYAGSLAESEKCYLNIAIDFICDNYNNRA